MDRGAGAVAVAPPPSPGATGAGSGSRSETMRGETLTDPQTYEAFKFFREWSGYSVPPGRAACALASARAERLFEQAKSEDLATFDVTYDFEPYDPGDMCSEDEAARKFESGEWTGPFGCVLTVGDETFSLWGVVVGPEAENDPYIRCVRADLASEAADDLAQALSDAHESPDVAEILAATR